MSKITEEILGGKIVDRSRFVGPIVGVVEVERLNEYYKKITNIQFSQTSYFVGDFVGIFVGVGDGFTEGALKLTK